MTTTATKTLKAGDILAASWGWEQTNYDFYRVDRVTAKTAWLAKLETINDPIVKYDENGNPGPSTMTSLATPGELIAGKKLLRRKIGEYSGETSIKINDYKFAYLWDGNPKHASHYG